MLFSLTTMQFRPTGWLRRSENNSAILQLQNRPAEIAAAVARYRAPFAIVDLELVDLASLRSLCSEFPATAFVCIHRLADDRMWADALAMGAVDCCHSSDVRGILMASERYVVLSRSHSAAA